MDHGWTRRLCAASLAALAGLALQPPGHALAATPTITFVPPAGADVDRAGGPDPYFRTAQAQPTIGIEASGGASLQCRIDVGTWTPCGAPLPGCHAARCGSWRPSAPLGAGLHGLDVMVDDDATSTESQEFGVDLSPPSLYFGIRSKDDPLRPVFGFDVVDNDPFMTVPDRADCALTRLGRAPGWAPCPAGGQVMLHLPKRHVDYRMWVRATDDFGRTTTKHYDFDPVPCALAWRRPRNLRALASGGILVHVTCSFTHRALIGLWVLRSTHAYAEPPLIAGLEVHSRRSHFSIRRRLRLFQSALAPTRRFPHVTFRLKACAQPDCLEYPGVAHDESGTRLTLRH